MQASYSHVPANGAEGAAVRVVGEVGLQQAGEELHWRKLLQMEGRYGRQPRQVAKDLQWQGTDGRAGYVPEHTVTHIHKLTHTSTGQQHQLTADRATEAELSETPLL